MDDKENRRDQRKVPKPKSEIMRTLRKARKELGLVEFRRWVRPEDKAALEKLADKLEKKPRVIEE